MPTKLPESFQRSTSVNFRSVSRCKYDYNDPDEKIYWKKFISQVELLAKKRARESGLRQMNLWSPLPSKLCARVAKHVKIPLESEEETGDSLDENEDQLKIKQAEDFNESSMSEILEQERNYREIKLKIDPQPEKRSKAVRNVNWMSNYTGRRQKDRVKWKSKLYKLERDILEKSLFEQAEEVMDRAAESFAQWVNSLGSCQYDALTKDAIKQLFSIEMSEFATTAIHVEPKEIKVVPNEIAQKWNLPEMSLEYQVEKYLKKKKTRCPKKPVTVAFGRTLPLSMRSWISTDSDEELKPYFPSELITKEILFKGITHLRSTKNLIDHYIENEHLSRPQYLVDIGSFKRQLKEDTTENTPLYELFQQRKRGF